MQELEFYLGNLEARRDWGYALEYMEGAWRIMQFDEPEDFVPATGESHSVREFCDKAFAHAGLDSTEHVRHDPRYERPSEVDQLVGDASKAERLLGWKPQVRRDDLVRIMVDADIQLLDDELRGRTVRVGS